MNIKIRDAKVQDYEPLLDLFDLVDTLHQDNLSTIVQKPSGPAQDQEFFQSLLIDQ